VGGSLTKSLVLSRKRHAGLLIQLCSAGDLDYVGGFTRSRYAIGGTEAALGGPKRRAGVGAGNVVALQLVTRSPIMTAQRLGFVCVLIYFIAPC